jgi:hypothetical protein
MCLAADREPNLRIRKGVFKRRDLDHELEIIKRGLRSRGAYLDLAWTHHDVSVLHNIFTSEVSGNVLT